MILSHFLTRYEDEINKRTEMENDFVLIKKVRASSTSARHWGLGLRQSDYTFWVRSLNVSKQWANIGCFLDTQHRKVGNKREVRRCL